MDTRFWLAITGQPKAKQPCRVGQEWDIVITISIIISYLLFLGGPEQKQFKSWTIVPGERLCHECFIWCHGHVKG